MFILMVQVLLSSSDICCTRFRIKHALARLRYIYGLMLFLMYIMKRLNANFEHMWFV